MMLKAFCLGLIVVGSIGAIGALVNGDFLTVLIGLLMAGIGALAGRG